MHIDYPRNLTILRLPRPPPPFAHHTFPNADHHRKRNYLCSLALLISNNMDCMRSWTKWTYPAGENDWSSNCFPR